MRTKSRLIAGSLLALSATGCFATKGDIRLLQDELRATRASVAQSDSARRRTSDSLAVALASLGTTQTRTARDAQAAQQRTADSLRALSARVNSNDINTREQLKSITGEIDQLRENVRQNARSQTLTRAQVEQARQAALPVSSDSTAATPASTTPGPATLLVSGKSQMIQGSCAAARRAFQEVLTLYPESLEAAEAQYGVAESFVGCGDTGDAARADSVYRIVTERYPQSDFAATSLYKRAEMLRLASKLAEARPLYERIVCQHPRSTVFAQALNRLGGTRPNTCR